jgi:hypothetical protein
MRSGSNPRIETHPNRVDLVSHAATTKSREARVIYPELGAQNPRARISFAPSSRERTSRVELGGFTREVDEGEEGEPDGPSITLRSTHVNLEKM